MESKWSRKWHQNILGSFLVYLKDTLQREFNPKPLTITTTRLTIPKNKRPKNKNKPKIDKWPKIKGKKREQGHKS
jgi:hypothetical protein